jgi:RNase P/RNase MRP subunit p29
LAVFWLGAMVGMRKADFTLHWGDNYERNFGGFPRGSLPPPLGQLPDPNNTLSAHGTSGEVLKIDGNTLVIKGENNTEKTVVVDNSTTITKQRQTINISGVKVDDSVVVIGSPNNQGQIQAKFIRVFGN